MTRSRPESERAGHSNRLWSLLPAGAGPILTSSLAPTDLQSLLLEVTSTRAEQITPARLGQRWADDRFVRPSGADPRALADLEARLWGMLPDVFDGVELSPVAPLGTCSAVGAADQNRILTTVRNSEVVSDPTNVLALEVAGRRRRGGAADVHLAACQRVLRTQDFGPGSSAHFKLFALVSGGRDRGSYRTEADLLLMHLRFWLAVLDGLLPGGGAVDYSIFGAPGLAERVRESILPSLESATTSLAEDPGRSRGRGYYIDGAMLINGRRHGEKVELGDGGFTDWTAQLTANSKERCLVSCISTERLLELSQA